MYKKLTVFTLGDFVERVPATISDFIKLQKRGLLGELVAFEVKKGEFQMCAVNVSADAMFILHYADLQATRVWAGTRKLWDVAEKIGVRELLIKSALPLPQEEAKDLSEPVKLSGGFIVEP